jgi:hypothetical protein
MVTLNNLTPPANPKADKKKQMYVLYGRVLTRVDGKHRTLSSTCHKQATSKQQATSLLLDASKSLKRK